MVPHKYSKWSDSIEPRPKLESGMKYFKIHPEFLAKSCSMELFHWIEKDWRENEEISIDGYITYDPIFCFELLIKSSQKMYLIQQNLFKHL